jgi:hypothetical protein
MTDDRGQKSEVRGQKMEVRCQRALKAESIDAASGLSEL